MTYQEIVNTVKNFLVEEFEVEEDKILNEASLKDTLDLDSLDYIDLIVAVEEHFSFKMKPEDFIPLQQVQDFYHFIAQQLEVPTSA